MLSEEASAQAIAAPRRRRPCVREGCEGGTWIVIISALSVGVAEESINTEDSGESRACTSSVRSRPGLQDRRRHERNHLLGRHKAEDEQRALRHDHVDKFADLLRLVGCRVRR